MLRQEVIEGASLGNMAWPDVKAIVAQQVAAAEMN